MRVAILFAVRRELIPLARRLRPGGTLPMSLRPYPSAAGRLGDQDLFLLAGGVGAARAGAAAESVVLAVAPDLLVMAGVAGALAASLSVGDLVVATRVLGDGEPWIPPVIPSSTNAQASTGTILSVDRILVTAQEKRAAFGSADPPPLAVEMETAAVARVAQAHGIPWAAVRAISDTAGEDLPLDFNRLRAPDGDLPTSRVALAALERPAAIPGLLRLGRNTSHAARTLAGFLEEWLLSEPCSGGRKESPHLPS